VREIEIGLNIFKLVTPSNIKHEKGLIKAYEPKKGKI